VKVPASVVRSNTCATLTREHEPGRGGSDCIREPPQRRRGRVDRKTRKARRLRGLIGIDERGSMSAQW